MLAHTEEKPYNKGGEHFGQRVTFSTYQKTHTREKPFVIIMEMPPVIILSLK